MADEYLNGRVAADSELAALERGRRRELEQGKGLLAGLLSQYPRTPAGPPVSTLSLPVLP